MHKIKVMPLEFAGAALPMSDADATKRAVITKVFVVKVVPDGDDRASFYLRCVKHHMISRSIEKINY